MKLALLVFTLFISSAIIYQKTKSDASQETVAVEESEWKIIDAEDVTDGFGHAIKVQLKHKDRDRPQVFAFNDFNTRAALFLGADKVIVRATNTENRFEISLVLGKKEVYSHPDALLLSTKEEN